MKRNVGTFVAVAVLASLLVLGAISKHGVPAVHAQGGCTAATVTGGYGFVTLNSFLFDGAGNSSTSFTDSSNGAIDQFTDTGTYTVNPDCTGSATLTGLDVHLQFVIVNGGTEILGIQTDPGPTTVDFKKQ